MLAGKSYVKDMGSSLSEKTCSEELFQNSLAWFVDDHVVLFAKLMAAIWAGVHCRFKASCDAFQAHVVTARQGYRLAEETKTDYASEGFLHMVVPSFLVSVKLKASLPEGFIQSVFFDQFRGLFIQNKLFQLDFLGRIFFGSFI